MGIQPPGVGEHSSPLLVSVGVVQSSDFCRLGGPTGTFAVISILVGNICLQLAPESKFRVFNNATNETYVDTAAMEAERLHVSATLACLTAVIQVRGAATHLPGPASVQHQTAPAPPQSPVLTLKLT